MDTEVLGPQRLERLLHAGRTLVSELDPELVLRRLLEAARELTGARYAALGILDEDRRGLERFITVGIDDETHAAIGALPRGRGVLGLLISEPQPLRLAEVGEHPRSYGFPPNHPPMSTFLGGPILNRGLAFGNLYLTEKQGTTAFTEADESAAIVLADWAAVAIDNARLYESAESRRERLETAVRRMEAMTEVARALGGETDLDRILETVVKRGRALVSADWLVILLSDGDELVVAAVAGDIDTERQGQRIPVEGSAAGSALRSMKSQRLTDLQRLKEADDKLIFFDADTELIVPMAFRGAGIGVMIAGEPLGDREEFGSEDEELLSAFAASAATAVGMARSLAEDRVRDSIASAEREKRRWAMELHDETLQGLGALKVTLSSALKSRSSDTLSRTVQEAVQRIDEEIDNLRGLISELRPVALDELGLGAAVEGLLERFETTQDLNVEQQVSLRFESGQTPDRLTPDVESTVYRVVQEALTNVAKHSGASSVSVGISESADEIEVAIVDDGVGIRSDAKAEGFGLVGMRERVDMVGGSLSVRSVPEDGTELHATVPALHRTDGMGRS
jgi:signal transduction histidine kinase